MYSFFNRPVTALLFLIMFASYCTVHADEPVTIVNDSYRITFDLPPNRTITMNQTPTEIMLTLGLEKQMVGTAYIDDEILPLLGDAYQGIPVLAEKYPSKEIILNARPDFVYGGFLSAFSEKRGLPTRKELQTIGIKSYVSPSSIFHKLTSQTPWSMDLLYQEIQDIGKIFRIEKKAGHLIDSIKNELSGIASRHRRLENRPRVLWLDSFSDRGPMVGGGTGPPHAIISLAGGRNIFKDTSRSWANVSKEQIISRPIDLIVLIEAVWSPSKTKIRELEKDPVFSRLEAVQRHRYVIINYSASTGGIRTIAAIKKLAGALADLSADLQK